MYIDLAKLSEERVPVLKALFERWIDIASWHRPSVIVLDNLDSVVGAEAEVRSFYIPVPSDRSLIRCT